MTQSDKIAFSRSESAYLDPPDEPEPHACDRCGEVPESEQLAYYNGEFLCVGCLWDEFPKRGVYDDWRDPYDEF